MNFYTTTGIFAFVFLCMSLFANADDVEFSHERGYYDNSFSLELNSDIAGATIRYALNGGALSVSTGQIYSTPITINTNTSIRAIAYSSLDTSVVFSHTYIFVDDVITQADNINNFPTATGIDNSIQNDAQYGPLLDDALTSIPVVCISIDSSYYNYIYTTKGNLRAANVEFFDISTGETYGKPSGVQTYGNTSFSASNANKKNYRFKFREEFGAKKFKHPIFGKEAVDEFDVFDLRAGSQSTIDRGGVQNIHEKFLKDLQIQMSDYGVHGRFVHVYINAVYWGVYTLSERPEKAFGESYFSGQKEDYNTIKATCCNTTALAIDGTTTSYNYMKSQAGNYPAIEQYLDVDHFIDWVMLCNYGPHGDWRTWNTYAIDNPVAGEPYRFFMWDPEPSLYNDWYYTDILVGTRDHNDIWNPLAANADFRMRVADHFECNCIEPDGPLNPANVESYYTEMFDAHSLAYLAECGRWADKTLYQAFLQYRDDLVSSGWFYNRMNALKTAYETNNLYPTIDAVQYSLPSSAVSAGTQITLSNPNGSGTIYYTTDGSDPRNPGGGISGSAQAYSGAITLSPGVVEIKARVRINSSTWSAMCPKRYYIDQDYSGLVINEIMYHPDDTCSINPDEMDYLEIFNAGSTTVNLTDTEFACGVDYTFPIGTTIAPGDYMILAENIDTFNFHYGFMPDGQFKGGLSNDGEEIVWQDFRGITIDAVTYNDVNPWDEEPDGNGPSLELLDPTLDNADPINWFRSDALCGTPGAANSRTCANAATSIVINEINYNSNNGITDPGDWVELYNPNPSPVDISDWTFYDNNNEFIFPAGTIIQPDDYLVLVENDVMFTSIFPHLTTNEYLGNFVFGLSNKGERVSLFDENKCLSDYVVYNDRIPWDTIPDGNGPTLSLITPNSDNTLPQSWEASSNINSAYGTPGRANEPCLENIIELPSVICAGFPTEIKVDVAYSEMDFTWFASGATPSTFTTDSETLIWNTPGTYNLQLVTKYFECTKSYIQQVTVEACNTIPNVIDDNFAINEDNVLSNNVLTNDSDPDNDNLTVNTTPLTNVSNGTLTLNPDGTFDYTPNPDFYGTDSFTYEVCDDAAVGSVTVSGGNFVGAVASGGDDAEELAADGSIDITSTDLDLIEDSPEIYSAVGLRITNITIPQGATVTGAYLEFVADEAQSGATSLNISAEATGNAATIPTTNYALTSMTKTSASASWANIPAWTIGNTYQSADISPVVQEIINRGDWANGNAMTFIIEGTGRRTAESFNGTAAPKLVVDYEVVANGGQIDVSLCDIAVVTINVDPVNDNPVAIDDNALTTEDVLFNGDVSTNDSDTEDVNLTVNTTPVSDVSNGTLTLNSDGTYSYLPNANFFGTDSFTYEICDSGSPVLCTQATVTITVDAMNDAPVAQIDIYQIQEDAAISNNVLTNDSDVENHTLNVTTTPVTPPTNGTLILNADGTFTYTPNADFSGFDSFTYEVCDNGTPSECSTATVNINIIGENDAPIAVNDTDTTTEDTPFTGNATANDSDIEGDNLTVNITPITPPQNGTLVLLASGFYSYTPNPDFYGTDTFEYEICDDGNPVLCDIASVTIDVTPVNDAPTPAPDTLYMLANSTIQDNVLLNDSDIENDNLTAMISPMAAPINGSVIIQPNGNINYTPNPNYVGTDSFTYEVCDDGTPSMCNTETVVIIIEPDCVDIELYAWLEGAYDPTLGEMRTTLVSTRKLLPGQTPASNLAIPTPAGQPYSGAPWNYAGMEGDGWTDADYTGDETDWVLASFRTGIEKSTEVGMTAGLLMKDGSIEFPNRCALVSTVASPLYIVLEHRNHIGIMTPQPVALTNSTLTYDFRSSDSYRDQTSFGQKQLPTGEWTMFAGDADQSDFPSFDIKGTDKTVWFDNNGIFDYYFSPDFNLDGDINGQDKSLWFENNGISSRVPK